MKEELTFEDSRGNKLSAILSTPSEDLENPIIVLCHGFHSSKNGGTYINLEEILNEEDVSTFRFDFYGHGESEGNFKDVTISRAVDDILSAIDFLKSLGYSKIGLMGSSFGGMASILAASKTDDIFLLALKSPVSDSIGTLIAEKSGFSVEEWKDKGYIYHLNKDENKSKLNYSFLEDAEGKSGYRVARKIKVPTLIVHGDEDKAVPVEQSKKTADLIDNCELKVIKGADHRYTNAEHFNRMLEFISSFIIEKST